MGSSVGLAYCCCRISQVILSTSEEVTESQYRMASAPTASRPGIPLANLTNPQAANPTPTSNTALQSTNAAPPAAPQAPSALQQTSNFSPRRTKWLNEAFSFANGIGTFALITAIVFGIGAWVGMKIQISQGGKNMDLAIWTACADHEVRGWNTNKTLYGRQEIMLTPPLDRPFKGQSFANLSWPRISPNSRKEKRRRDSLRMSR